MNDHRHVQSKRQAFRRWVAFVTSALSIVFVYVAVAPQAYAATTSGFFTADTGRLLDTRNSGGALTANSWRTINAGGQLGIPTTGVTALSVSFTALGGAKSGFLSSVAAGAPQQYVTSQLYWNAGETISNSAVVATDDSGAFQVYAYTSVQLLIDVQGYFSTTTGTT